MERAQWARANGIEPRSLNVWRVNLGRGRSGERAPRLVELVPEVSTGTQVTYTVRCGAFSVEVGADFDVPSLQRLLALVASC